MNREEYMEHEECELIQEWREMTWGDPFEE